MQLDVRSPRFAAWITTLVLIIVLVTGNGWLALAQTAVFALSAARLRWSPYGLLYRHLVAPRLRPATEFEPAEPVRFAQLLGFAFGLVATVGYLAGAPVVGLVAAALALAAAFLNAAFGFCLGCETYLLLRRLGSRRTTAATD
ncbi:MAG TPA: DUF4395 domain-containing protein [Micromonosporaceae bacterium]